jgi:hypothetical protein
LSRRLYPYLVAIADTYQVPNIPEPTLSTRPVQNVISVRNGFVPERESSAMDAGIGFRRRRWTAATHSGGRPAGAEPAAGTRPEAE